MENEGPGSIAVYSEGSSNDVLEKASCLASILSLPFVLRKEEKFDLLLTVTEKQLELRLNQRNAPGPVYVDFMEGPLGYVRRLNPFGQLIKAICSNKSTPRVLDTTAGLAHDAFILVHKGCNVLAVERSPVLMELIKDGIERTKSNKNLHCMLNKRLELICPDACDVLKDPSLSDSFDVVYIDPMFPPKKKTALVKKEMRIVRSLVGDDKDSSELLDLAREVVAGHVVVKRMLHAPPLAPDPSRTLRGRTCRFDIYDKKRSH